MEGIKISANNHHVFDEPHDIVFYMFLEEVG